MNRKEIRIEELRQEFSKKDKEVDVKIERIRKKIDKLEKLRKEVGEISTHLFWVKQSLFYEYQEKIQELCDHSKHRVGKRENMRDDSSFRYWLFCSNCKADLGFED